MNDKGFRAEWNVPFTARGIRAAALADTLSALQATAVGLSLVELGDPYQSVNRSLKYVLLILGLVFLSYFGFEATTARRLHPAQYVLVGLAQIISYLLLLWISERIGFDLGFLCAAGATAGLLSLNATWIFESNLRGIQALALFGALYSLIYLLLRMEDNSLFIGAIGSFFVIALLMYLTREWIGTARRSQPVPVRANRAVPEMPFARQKMSLLQCTLSKWSKNDYSSAFVSRWQFSCAAWS